MSPTVACIRQLAAASELNSTHFSHISPTMRSLRRATKPAPVKAASISPTRSDAAPSRAPNTRS